MNDTVESQIEEPPGVLTSISIVIIIACIYAIGLFLHIRIIHVSRKEKDLTWKIDISNSVFLLTYYGFSVFIHCVTNIIPNLYIWTGISFCYISKVILHYGLRYTIAHSMVISMLKYFVIVRPEAITVKLKEKLKAIFFWINLLHPIVDISIHLVLTPDFYVQYGGFATANKCLGNPNLTKKNVFQMCSFIAPTDKYSLANFLYVLKRTICIGQAIYMYIVAFNIFDIIFYTTIFQHMKRKILPRNNNISTRSLSQNSNEINRKKIKVNSQITAMISFLEFSINMFYIILLGFVVKKTSFGTLITAMILYLIVLPYSFLMNTSNNKNRVVEVGWKTIFKNIVLGALNSTDTTSQTSSLKGTQSQNTIEDKTGSKVDINMDNKISSTICSVSKSQSNHHFNSSTNDLNDEKPTTSNCFDVCNESPVRSVDESINNEILLNPLHLDKRKNIVSMMVDSLNDENLYLIYFKHFLDFERRRQQGKHVSFDVRVEDLLKDDDVSIAIGFGHNKTKKKSSKHIISNPTNSERDFSISYHAENTNGNKMGIVYKNSKRERNNLRKTILLQLEKCYKMKNSTTKYAEFNSLIDELIDLEENFIEQK